VGASLSFCKWQVGNLITGFLGVVHAENAYPQELFAQVGVLDRLTCAQLGSQSAVKCAWQLSKEGFEMYKFLTIGLLALVTMASAAEAKSGVKIGVLSCEIEGGPGFIIGSSKAVDCVYEPASGARSEHYSGTIGKLGIDIGVTGRTVVAWAVFAPGKVSKGALKGSYTGASAEATVAVGLGANVLVGGFKKGINLQPISVQGQTGLNIAAGVANLKLRYVG
jgi:hypothetical protein